MEKNSPRRPEHVRLLLLFEYDWFQIHSLLIEVPRNK